LSGGVDEGVVVGTASGCGEDLPLVGSRQVVQGDPRRIVVLPEQARKKSDRSAFFDEADVQGQIGGLVADTRVRSRPADRAAGKQGLS
jgi:hypothetical protein